MNLQEAMRLAESWTRDMQPTRNYTDMPIFDAMRTLLDHVRQQNKDIEELTQACRVLFRRNKELENELQRSEKTS